MRTKLLTIATILLTLTSYNPARALDTEENINANVDPKVTLTDEEIEVAAEKVTEEDIEEADAETEAAIRALDPGTYPSSGLDAGIDAEGLGLGGSAGASTGRNPGTNSTSGLGAGIDTEISVFGVSGKSPVRPASVLNQVNNLVAMGAEGFWYSRNNLRSYYSSSINWSTDFCSWSRDTGLYFDFRSSCAHHDFGYRNYKKLNVFNSQKKDYVDAIFYRDMKAHCSTRSIFFKPDCYALALVYYKFVQKFGD